MKKFITTLMILAVTAIGFAQQQHKGELKKGMHSKMEKFTPEQMGEMRAKRLTLALDLSDKQQKELTKLFTENASEMKKNMEAKKADKEAGKEMNHYAMMNNHLDAQIATNRKIKSILTEAQFDKYTAMQGKMKGMMAKRGHMSNGHQCNGQCKMEGKEGKMHKGEGMNKQGAGQGRRMNL